MHISILRLRGAGAANYRDSAITMDMSGVCPLFVLLLVLWYIMNVSRKFDMILKRIG